MNITMRVSGADQISNLADRFRRAAATLQSRLVAGLREEADSALAETRAAFRGIEVSSSRGGGSSSGLRARTAAATRIVVTATGVGFEVDAAAVDPRYGRSLSYGLDGLGNWGHPVFGRPGTWTTERGQEVFYRTLRGRADRWENRLTRVVDEVTREIQG